ncbi:MAG: lytic transglycosylase domain-containing protein [Acidobacteria bacterium]|nr:lytic transglycosylase domain-containing protein [Acidobacteriota bacterium]MBV9924815.1 lytic transglycosylase domain-containing protein [Acidobacteriota bacterium]
MHFTPRKPLRSFKNVVFAVIIMFVVSNFIDSPFTRVLAPVSASAVSAAVSIDDYIPADVPTSGDHDLDLVIERTGRNLGVDPRLIHAVIWQESKYKTDAESHVGAQGLMQLMPAAAKRFGCDDRNDVEGNITAGTKYLRFLLKRFDGNVTLALAAYNAGEGNVDKYEGVPPFGETQNYVRIITGRYGKTYHPVLTPEEASSYFDLLPSR